MTGDGTPPPPAPDLAHDDEEEEELYCYRHGDRETALRCLECERPICIDCAIQGAVGIKCPECGRLPRAARAVVPPGRLARGAVAALVAALALGFVLQALSIGLLGIILGYLVGMGVGEATRAASGGFRDPLLGRIAATCAFAGVIVFPLVQQLSLGTTAAAMGSVLVWKALAAAAAAFGAWSRAA